MPTESFEVSRVIPAPADRIYDAWLNGDEHGRMTGGKATGSDALGSAFTAWDGYIQGTNVLLDRPRRIVQSWRTNEFPEGAGDSRVELSFDTVEGGTRVTVRHSDVPEGQSDRYRSGWGEHYFDPMSKYFASPMARLREAGEAVSGAAEQVGEAFQAVGEQATERAGEAIDAVKKTAKTAAKNIRTLVKKARKQLKKVGPKKKKAAAKSKSKSAGKKRPAAKSKSKKAAKKKKR